MVAHEYQRMVAHAKKVPIFFDLDDTQGKPWGRRWEEKQHNT